MQTDQERLYVASRMVSGVADCLIEFASCAELIELWDLMELVGQLKVAVETNAQNQSCNSKFKFDDY
jgi:hypothetical protein